MRAASHRDHKKFVETEGWTKTGTAHRAGATGNHSRYQLALADGRVLYTRVSHGAGGIDDAGLWGHILRSQLEVNEGQFWACVERSDLPPRPQPAQHTSTTGIDGRLAMNLLRKVGLTPAQIAELDQARAVAVWQRWLTEGAGRAP